MSAQKSERKVRIVSQGYNTWRVQVLFHDTDLSAAETSDRLKEVKADLAQQFGVPDSLLEYKKLLSKKMTRLGLLVEMQITKQELPSGAPIFTALPLKLDDDTMFSDMRLEATLFPYDEFDHPLTRSILEVRLKTAGFDLSCIQWPVVMNALEEVERTLQPVKDLEIGRGVPPNVGRSSQLTYNVAPHQGQFIASAWIGTRPVVQNQHLVEVSLPTTGRGRGRNVYGRELESRPGFQTRLVAGQGTKLVGRDTQVIAVRDGLVMFEREGADKRSRDTCDFIPVKLTISVLPLATVHTTQALDMELTEPTAILGSLEPGSKIRSSQPLYIEGNVCEGSVISCTNCVRIAGNVLKSQISSDRHLAINGDVDDSSLKAGLTIQVDGHVIESALSGMDVIVNEITGGSVEALRQTSISRTNDAGGKAADIRVNLEKYFADRQAAGQEVLMGFADTMKQVLDMFGPEIFRKTSESSAQRLLLKWLKQQKRAGTNYTHAEVQELRTVLEMVPMIQQQMQAIGMEMKDITDQFSQSSSEEESDDEKEGEAESQENS